MKAIFCADEPDKIEMTMTITMSLAEWKRVKETIQVAGGSYALGKAIRDMVCQAEANFMPMDPPRKENEERKT